MVSIWLIIALILDFKPAVVDVWLEGSSTFVPTVDFKAVTGDNWLDGSSDSNVKDEGGVMQGGGAMGGSAGVVKRTEIEIVEWRVKEEIGWYLS
ncbi:hypothetical protein F0562_010090 [Nyssa sinensis]|uniref:Uncharacterized protein n=1 Tax=Nyssa sinensis TaxID=561372 RepID=A0A5J5A2V9_9ASTE|nr:hypothetical protein F0562_010090 [Nyssa sinensis]